MPFRMPRMPSFVAPASLAPGDVLNAVAATDMDIVQSLVREPLAALGVTTPDLPQHPMAMLAQALSGVVPAMPGQTSQGQTPPTPGRVATRGRL